MRQRPRAHSIPVREGVLLPALSVGEDTAEPIGFLARHGEREEPARPLSQPNPDWRAPTKINKRR